MTGDTPQDQPAPEAPRPAPAGRAPSAPRKRRPRKPPPPGMRLMVMVAAAILLLDQALKYVVIHVLNLDRVREIDLIDPWLNLRMAWNQGINFGLMSSDTDLMRWVLIGIALVICLWVVLWLRNARRTRLLLVSAGLLVGGALGNVIDRAIYGAVADFLNMSLPNWRNPYSFNVADIAIFAGAIGLFLHPPEKPAKGKKRKPAPRKPREKPRAGAGDDKTRDAGQK